MKHVWLILVLLCYSCEKEKEPHGDKQEMPDLSIEILSPKVGMEQDTVSIFLTDRLSLHEYTVSIDDSAGTNYFYQEGHSHMSQLLLSWPWDNTAPAGTVLTLRVRVTNHKLDLLEKTMQFQSAP